MASHPIFAAVYDRVLAGSEKAGLADHRAELLAGAHGRVLELGAGTGANLAHYPAAVEELVLSEPDPYMARRLCDRLDSESPPFKCEVIEAGAERLDLGDAGFDTVVSTLVFCTVEDPSRAAAEVARVLRPGGTLLLFEHVRDPDNELRARWQDRLERPWGWVAGACHPNRDTAAVLGAAGFDVSPLAASEFPNAGPLVKPALTGAVKKPNG